MRSRYSAYALGQTAYLQNTWHASTRPPPTMDEENTSIKWLKLDILEHHTQEDEATVSFVATCKISGRLTRLKETSRFVRQEGRWWYLDGEIVNA